MEHQEHTHIVSYKTFIIIWAILLVFTGITVGVTYLHLGIFAVSVALVVASIKALLVLTYFMHLKYDNKMLAAFVGVTFLVFTSFIVLTFIDYANR